jgi:hypothetical protein
LTGEDILACGHGYSPRLPAPWNLWAVAYCGFPTSKAHSVNRISFEDFFPILFWPEFKKKICRLQLRGSNGFSPFSLP